MKVSSNVRNVMDTALTLMIMFLLGFIFGAALSYISGMALWVVSIFLIGVFTCAVTIRANMQKQQEK